MRPRAFRQSLSYPVVYVGGTESTTLTGVPHRFFCKKRAPRRSLAGEVRAGGGAVALRFTQEVPHVDLHESPAVLTLLTTIPANPSPLPHSPNSSAGAAPASESPRLWSGGREGSRSRR
jgi:hypothetical protein